MQSDSDSTAGARPDVNGSDGPSASPSSAGEQSSTEAINRLVQQLAETNVHLLVLADQVAKALAHVSVLLDLLVTIDEEDTQDTAGGTYLDGSPIL